MPQLGLPIPPPFSSEEMQRRRDALTDVAAGKGADRIVVYGAERSGTAVPWLTRWAVTREAAVVVGRDERDALHIHFHNHVRLASEIAKDADVRWGGESIFDEVADELERRGGRTQTIGMVGSIPYQLRDVLAERFSGVVDLTRDYDALRLIKSPEEIEHLRYGAALSDAALAGLIGGIEVGRSDFELIDRIERAYVPLGGTTHIHYLSITQMDAPDRPVPAQQPVGAVLRPGSVVVTELSAAFRGYPGQVLRTIVLADEPSDLYAELHEVAMSAYASVTAAIRPGATASDLHAAAACITEAGFRLNDDLVHGFGGGYLPPVIGRLEDPVVDFTLREGMTMVVQPNVITADGRAGVQTGELVVVTEDGFASLHTAAPGLVRIPV